MSAKLSAVFLAILLAATASAQVATGNLRGTVTDSTGAVLPNCVILIVNTQTGFQRRVMTNERGDFNAPSVPVGFYDVSAELSGFQKKITNLLFEGLPVVAVDGVDNFVSLFDDVRLEVGILLLPVPGASAGSTEALHQLDQVLKGFARHRAASLSRKEAC